MYSTVSVCTCTLPCVRLQSVCVPVPFRVYSTICHVYNHNLLCVSVPCSVYSILCVAVASRELSTTLLRPLGVLVMLHHLNPVLSPPHNSAWFVSVHHYTHVQHRDTLQSLCHGTLQYVCLLSLSAYLSCLTAPSVCLCLTHTHTHMQSGRQYHRQCQGKSTGVYGTGVYNPAGSALVWSA